MSEETKSPHRCPPRTAEGEHIAWALLELNTIERVVCKRCRAGGKSTVSNAAVLGWIDGLRDRLNGKPLKLFDEEGASQ